LWILYVSTDQQEFVARETIGFTAFQECDSFAAVFHGNQRRFDLLLLELVDDGLLIGRAGCNCDFLSSHVRKCADIGCLGDDNAGGFDKHEV
jgi:hypothetical protein